MLGNALRYNKLLYLKNAVTFIFEGSYLNIETI